MSLFLTTHPLPQYWTLVKEQAQIYTLFHNLAAIGSIFLLVIGEKLNFVTPEECFFLCQINLLLFDIQDSKKKNGLDIAVSLIIVLTPLGYRGMINHLKLRWSSQSVLSFSTDYSDVLGVGVFLPRLVMNVHPASAHTLDCDCLTIHFNLICVDRGEGHFSGSVSSPPLNQ